MSVKAPEEDQAVGEPASQGFGNTTSDGPTPHSDDLQVREARFRALFEPIDDGLCIIEFFDGPHGPLSDYVHVEVNPGYERQTGIADVLGQTVRELAPTEAEAWIELYGRVLQTGESARFERYFEAAGRFIEVSAARVEPANRHQVLVLFRDITARREAEAALRESQAALHELNTTLEQRIEAASAALLLYENIVQSDTAPICAFNTEYRLIAFNRAHSDEFFRIYGYRVQLGDVFPDLFLPEQAAIMRGFMTRALTGEVFTVTEEFGDPNLVVPYWEVAYSPLRDADGQVIGAFHHAVDITARLRAQAELAETQEALRQSQKMEAVGQLTGGIAHDFNNLLAGISGSLELLERRLLQGRMDGVGRYITTARESAARAAILTQRLLAFARRQTLDPKVVDINRIVSGMSDLLDRAVGPDIHIEAVQGVGLWSAKLDPSQLENAILNLCINGRDAMAPKGGRITIETANKWMDDRAAKDRDLPPGQYISLCVSDTGTGMSAEVVEKAFDPFFTTKPLGQGTGLGLSMIYGFVRQSGGQVRIYSHPGEGATICLYFPRHHGPAEDMPAPAEQAVDRGDGETILVIDDEPAVRMLITDVLTENGYQVLEAADGPSGLRLLQEAGRIDLLVTDVGLPGGLNGRQVADAARTSRPNLKVLFITGFAENAAVGNGLLDSGMAVITKPFEMTALANKVREIIDLQTPPAQPS